MYETIISPKSKERTSPVYKKSFTFTAMPLRSEEADAAVGDVFATVLVLVSDMWILLTGIPKIREAICKNDIQLQSWAFLNPNFKSIFFQLGDLWKYVLRTPVSFWYADLGPFLFRHELGELIRLYKHERAHQPWKRKKEKTKKDNNWSVGFAHFYPRAYNWECFRFIRST